MIDIIILDQPLDISYCIQKVMTPDAGGIDVFIGTVRNNTNDNSVVRLEFEAYIPMAMNELQKISDYAMQKWNIKKIAIQHRVGILTTGNVAVVIAVSAAHRDAAFTACRYIIDTLKQTVPIWKKEVFENGEVWVAAHP